MLSPASGTGRFYRKSAKIIRFARHGCANRPFFHIVVTERRRTQKMPVIEQLGTFDPLENEHNEKLVSLNLERIIYWMGSGAHISRPVDRLFGLAGLLPIHPTSYMTAWRNRKEIENQAKEEHKEGEAKT
ncbi:30s ribosomal protein s16 [Holotrichia oblita]|uniref:30s ribosomal protein s16 n=1 Tax=Holotrichia oblita TaxID=644536 RepID=A0ACB9TK85_HOLOL|nr:30s ribosomal protein s16 [Holotrichia oblita]